MSSLALPTLAGATTIDYATVGDFTGTSFSTNGLTATAENGGSLSITGLGLGVSGGVTSVLIDSGESVRFSFDSGGATGVAFGFNGGLSGGNVPMNLEAFDLLGVSLGFKTFDVISAINGGTPIDVSALYGNVGLSAFRLASNAHVGGRMWRVVFTDAAPPVVPEPTTLLLCSTGLAFAGYRRRMMRH